MKYLYMPPERYKTLYRSIRVQDVGIILSIIWTCGRKLKRAVFKRLGCVSMNFIVLLACLFTYLMKKRNANACEPKSPKWALRTLLSWASRNFHDLRFVHLQFCCSSIEEVLVRMYLHPRAFLSFLPMLFLHSCPLASLGVASYLLSICLYYYIMFNTTTC